MKVTVSWELEIPNNKAGKLVAEAEDRGLGSSDDFGTRELIARLMMDGGEDTIQQILEDPAQTAARRIK